MKPRELDNAVKLYLKWSQDRRVPRAKLAEHGEMLDRVFREENIKRMQSVAVTGLTKAVRSRARRTLANLKDGAEF